MGENGYQPNERLAKLEKEVELRFDFSEKNIALARSLVDKAEALLRLEYEKHFETLNQHKASMERLELTFATKESLQSETQKIAANLQSEVRTIGNVMIVTENTFNNKLDTLKSNLELQISNAAKVANSENKSLARLVYIGVGIALAAQFIWPFILKMKGG